MASSLNLSEIKLICNAITFSDGRSIQVKSQEVKKLLRVLTLEFFSALDAHSSILYTENAKLQMLGYLLKTLKYLISLDLLELNQYERFLQYSHAITHLYFGFKRLKEKNLLDKENIGSLLTKPDYANYISEAIIVLNQWEILNTTTRKWTEDKIEEFPSVFANLDFLHQHHFLNKNRVQELYQYAEHSFYYRKIFKLLTPLLNHLYIDLVLQTRQDAYDIVLSLKAYAKHHLLNKENVTPLLRHPSFAVNITASFMRLQKEHLLTLKNRQSLLTNLPFILPLTSIFIYLNCAKLLDNSRRNLILKNTFFAESIAAAFHSLLRRQNLTPFSFFLICQQPIRALLTAYELGGNPEQDIYASAFATLRRQSRILFLAWSDPKNAAAKLPPEIWCQILGMTTPLFPPVQTFYIACEAFGRPSINSFWAKRGLKRCHTESSLLSKKPRGISLKT